MDIWISTLSLIGQYSLPLNDNVDKINEVIMAKFPGEGKTYLSADSVADEDMAKHISN